jgi:hypothetical protein
LAALLRSSAPSACFLLEPVDRRALGDRVAFLEQDRVEIAGDAGLDLHPVDGLDAADKIIRFRNRLLLGRHGADRHRLRRRGLLSVGRRERKTCSDPEDAKGGHNPRRLAEQTRSLRHGFVPH